METYQDKGLKRMGGLIPWKNWSKNCSRFIATGKTDRKLYPRSVILRAHVIQQLYDLSDPAMEDALYEIELVRRFSRPRLLDHLLDETTMLIFCPFLEGNKFGQPLFDAIQSHLASQGLKFQEGNITDATTIAAPTFTKDQVEKFDPVMRQTKKVTSGTLG